MDLASTLKLRYESERSAALALDHAVNGVETSSIGSLHDLKAGIERATWYSSCFFDQYADVCSELKQEDARFIKAIYEIYKRRNIIADMLKMYIEEELKGDSDAKVRTIDAKLTSMLTGYRVGKLTKSAIAESLAQLIVSSFHFQNDIILAINKYTPIFITVASFYGKVQVAALAARKLRALSPGLYQVLYQNNLEMLYFLISDKIEGALINSLGLPEEDRFIAVIQSLAR